MIFVSPAPAMIAILNASVALQNNRRRFPVPAAKARPAPLAHQTRPHGLMTLSEQVFGEEAIAKWTQAAIVPKVYDSAAWTGRSLS